MRLPEELTVWANQRKESYMTDETTAVMRYAAAALAAQRGRLDDRGHPSRPWIFIDCSKKETAQGMIRVFGVGNVKGLPGGGFRFYARANTALEVIDLLLEHLQPFERKCANRLLARWGDEGHPWVSEAQFARAHDTYSEDELAALEL